ncbi:MAG: PspA/IM30 family protein [Deltaproteobacteria bacterium]|nr:PspA/IM30 family protein [Deltaproteobacteria bacterium]
MRSRLTMLARGWLGQWIRRRERRNPSAVYEAAISERLEQYAALRSAAAGMIYLRGKLADQRDAAAQRLGGLEAWLESALDRDDDGAALLALQRRDALRAELTRLDAELAELTRESEAAKQNLIAAGEDLARLREEKVRMLGRLANARARIRLRRKLHGTVPDADLRALESVREDIERQVQEVQLERELEIGGSDPLATAPEREAAARAALAELKRQRRGRLLPVILPEAVAP